MWMLADMISRNLRGKCLLVKQLIELHKKNMKVGRKLIQTAKIKKSRERTKI